MSWYQFCAVISFVSLLFTRCMGSATTSAVCTTAEWTFNQNGMSPCAVAANLEAVCNGGDWNIPALPQGSDYSGPTSHQSTECTCSTVVYSMVAACSVCQQRESTTWSNWRENCSDHDISISVYPLALPSGVTVPAWAYLNVTASNAFDPNSALSVHNAGIPDVSDGNSTSAPPPVPTASPGKNTDTSGGGSNHLGAIIGGVVGGVVLIIIIACSSYYLYIKWRRGYRSYTSDEKTMFDFNSSPAPLNPAFPPIMVPPPVHDLKLYDPADPSTFPTTPVSSLPTFKSTDGLSTAFVMSSDEPVPPLSNHVNNHGQYTGVPEV